MDRAALQAMIDQGQLGHGQMDLDEASSRLAQALTDSGTADAILRSPRRNPKGAASLAWEGRRPCRAAPSRWRTPGPRARAGPVDQPLVILGRVHVHGVA